MRTQPSQRALQAPAPPVNKWLVTVSVTFGTLMGTIDTSIVNVALPHIRGAVGATLEEITWISTGYVVAQVVVMPLTAFMGRLFGQKTVYMFCLGLFLAGSVLCGLARSLETLVVFRAIQGFGAGALQPTEQAILRQTFPQEEQGMAMAVFGVAIMIGPAVGPTLGGYIVDHYSWEWIFYINVPVGALGLFMVANFVHEPADIRAHNRHLAAEQRRHMDWAGIALLCVGLATLQYLLEEGERNDWFQSRGMTLCAFIAVMSLAAFVIRELTATVPAVHLALFKDPVFLSGTAIGAVMFAMLMANMFLLPVFMQEVLGFTATQSGLVMMPRVLVMMVATPFIGRIYNHVDPRIVIAVGVVLFGVSAWQMSHFTLESDTRQIVSAVMVQGAGFSCLFVPLTTVALSQIARHRLADATGLNSVVRQIGGSIGLAAFATLLERYVTFGRADVAAHLAPTRPGVGVRIAQITNGLQAHGYDPYSAQKAAVRALSASVTRQAAAIAYERLFLLAGVLFLSILPILMFLKRPQNTDGAMHLELD